MPDLSIDVVAKAAGVHRSTVSRAFSRPEAVKAKHASTSSGSPRGSATR